jgi:hypothetical protein
VGNLEISALGEKVAYKAKAFQQAAAHYIKHIIFAHVQLYM